MNSALNPDATQILLSSLPGVLEEVLEAQQLPSKEMGYEPIQLDIYFEDVLVVRKRNRLTVHELSFSVDYKPNVITLYGDEELLLVQAHGQLVVNRLPEIFALTEWTHYGN